MSHPLYGPEIREMLLENNAAGLRAFCDTLHPATVADALDAGFTADEVWEALTPSDIRTQAAIFEYLPESLQIEMVEDKSRPQVGQLIGKMSHDDRADLVNRLPREVKEALLRVVDEADRRDIATLGTYAADTVGALMTTDYAWLPPTLTAAEADRPAPPASPRPRDDLLHLRSGRGDAPPGRGRVRRRKLLGIISASAT